jgi:hypothetical protein
MEPAENRPDDVLATQPGGAFGHQPQWSRPGDRPDNRGESGGDHRRLRTAMEPTEDWPDDLKDVSAALATFGEPQ